MIELKNINFQYNNNGTILKNISLKFERNEVVGLFGSSGYGKSTLAKIMSGILKPNQGEVYLDGKPLHDKGYSPVQLIHQHPEKAVNPKWRMKDILNEGWDVDETTKEKIGIQDKWLTRWPSELSGGELQRFCIARALSPKTHFIIADEISTMLDVITQAKIWGILLKEARLKNMGLIVVTHDMNLAEKICDRIVNLEEINAI